jgi:hypothetical protein
MATMEELYQQYLLTQPGGGGSQNRYRELMSQMRPFANPYPASTGLLAGAVPRTPDIDPLGTYSSGGGGGSGGGMTDSTWDGMTDAQKADFYANNPNMAGITQFGQNIFGLSSLGQAQALFDRDRVNREGLIAQGFDFNAYQKARDDFRETEREYTRQQEAIAQARAQAQAQAQAEAAQAQAEAAIGSYAGASFAEQQAIQQALAEQAAMNQPAPAFVPNATPQEIMARGAAYMAQLDAAQQAIAQQASNDAAEAAVGSYGGASFAEQQAINDAISAAQAQSISDQSGANYGGYDTSYGSGDTSGGFGEGQYAKGGKVIKDHLKGPDPKGPDEGYGALLGGEFVIKKSAVKKYGEGLLSMINDGKIPAKKMKSLLG